ncbi:hypothetical protein WJX81_005562 [Elliptochloris bilobata]|uniref:EF-hand domain-containing protein n=1 Tax=Elliptochloris bilobata TaxID=381761 RepID=A0AAW1SDB0_9CHLO
MLIFGITHLIMDPNEMQQRWMYLEVWRWGLFLAGVAPAYWLSEAAVHAASLLVETKLFTVHNAMLMAMAVSLRRPASRLVRSALLILLFVVSFQDGIERPELVQWGWNMVFKALVCLTLFCATDLLKTLAAKSLARTFHKEAHFAKMQDALEKEYILHALSQPRPHTVLEAEIAELHASRAAPGVLQQAANMKRVRSMSRAMNTGFEILRAAAGASLPLLPQTGSPKIAAARRASQAPARVTEAGDADFARSRRQGDEPEDGPCAAPANPSIRRGSILSTGKRGTQQSEAHALHTADRQELLRRVHNLERHMRENKLRFTFTDALGRAQSDTNDQVTSRREAKRLALSLFWNVRAEFSRDYITREDLDFFLEGEATVRAMRVLDTDGDGRISLGEMRDAVIVIYRERKNLAFTLKDTRTVVGKVELIFACALHSISVFFYLLIFNVDVSQVWMAVSSCLLGFVFVFGNSIRNLYEAVIFLFVVHPFDVGDVLLLGNGEWHQVESIALQATTLLRWDGVKIWYPNAKLLLEPVMNVARSNNRWEGFKALVDIITPASVFEAVDAAVTAHMKSEKAATEFTGEHICVANFATDPQKVTLCVWWEFSHPGENLRRMSRARHSLYMVIVGTLVAHGVRYTLPPYQGMPPWQSAPPTRGTPGDTAGYPGGVLASAAGGEEPLRPPGEGEKYMPAFVRKAALKL